MDYINLGYLGIFLAAFIASTLLPAPSELIILLAFENNFNVYLVISIATLGNVLGSLTNYYIGYFSNSKYLIKRFKLNQNKIDNWTLKSKKYGYWLGFLAWLPFIGDPLMAVVGFLKVKIIPLTLTITLGKLIRYIVVTLIYFLL
jgi:membrane protein YqaA with SNARE-associated domain